jgi:hypothetical protein
MVPDEYHDFFLGTVTVAAALVGLLFVAISVHPGRLGDDGAVGMRVRAWDYIGGARTGILGTVDEIRHGLHVHNEAEKAPRE